MRCEDYPCCGHTDGLPCDWTPNYSDPHFLCDHEIGDCIVMDAIDDAIDDTFEEVDDEWDGMEDEWLDGSYEE